MEKPADWIIWAHGQALRLMAGPAAAPARVQQTNVVDRPPSIPELAGLGIGRRVKRG